jgi:hypothetical protein
MLRTIGCSTDAHLERQIAGAKFWAGSKSCGPAPGLRVAQSYLPVAPCAAESALIMDACSDPILGV